MIPPEGAFYIFIDIREALSRAKDFANDNSLKFSEYLLEKYQVAMVPGEAFGVPGFLRLSYAVNEEDIEQGIARIGQALSSIC
jgi:aspartate aminotransferase